MTADLLFDIIGIAGMFCILIAYFLLQKGRMKPNGYDYLLTNLTGSVLLLISLLRHWNLAALLLQAAFSLITLYGLYKRFHSDRVNT